MASTNKTPNYALSQWVGTDPVLMEDFNADNAKVDAALAQLKSGSLKMATGSYTGTGSCGSAAANSISFDFTPGLVIIRKPYNLSLNPDGIGLVLIRPMSIAAADMYAESGTSNVRKANVAWGDKSVSWWVDNTYGNNESYNSNWQLNAEGVSYYYVAIGV